MLVKSSVAVVLLAASFTAAQTTSNSTIDPNSVSPTLRAQWCNGEINTCGILCSGSPANNTCDTDTLTYSCTCTSNNSAPGLQYYTQTMPTFICEQIYQNCIVSGQNDAAAQKLCTQNEQQNCGHLDPANFTSVATTSSSSSAAPTSTGAGAASTSGASTSSSKAAGATMMAMGREYGSGVLAAGVAAAFGMML